MASPPIANTVEIGEFVPPTHFATQTIIGGARPYVPPYRRYVEDGAEHEIDQMLGSLPGVDMGAPSPPTAPPGDLSPLNTRDFGEDEEDEEKDAGCAANEGEGKESTSK